MKNINAFLAALVVVGFTFGAAAKADEPIISCTVEDFGYLKAIDVYKSSKPGVAVELVETVLDLAGDSVQLVTLPPSNRAIAYDNYISLNTCVEYQDCFLQKNSYETSSVWSIKSCSDMAHNMGCNVYPVKCIERNI